MTALREALTKRPVAADVEIGGGVGSVDEGGRLVTWVTKGRIHPEDTVCEAHAQPKGQGALHKELRHKDDKEE